MSKKKFFTGLMAIVLVIAMLASIVVPAFADDQDDIDAMEREKEELEQEAADAEALANATAEELAEAQALVDEVMAEMEVINAELDEVGKKVIELNQKIADNEALLEQTEEELATATADLQVYYEALKSRIQMMYENDRTTYLEVLLNASSLSDFFSRFEYISEMVQYDNNIMENLNACKEKIEVSKATIENTQKTLEADRAEQVEQQKNLELLLSKKQDQMDTLESNRLALQLQKEHQEEVQAELVAQIQDLQSQIDYANAELQRKIEEEQRAAAEEAARIQREKEEAERKAAEEEAARKAAEESENNTGEESGETGETGEENSEDNGGESGGTENNEAYEVPGTTGDDASWRANSLGFWDTWPGIGSAQLGWPTNSFLATSLYGPRVHPITGEYKNHNGLDLAADYGTPIYSCLSGTVITVGYDGGGWGNYVVVDHGNGFTTLYAHCSSIAVSEGDYVSGGQTIAYMGSTGMSTGSHLHLEVYLYGSLVNPEDYL